MTNVMVGSYPDLFQAASVHSGVPFGCFAGPYDWNVACALGQIVKTPQEWGDIVRAAYPGYRGPRPKMLIWHGGVDTTLYPQNFWEEYKQWTNIFGYSQTPTKAINNDPEPGYIHWIFGKGNVQTYAAPYLGHMVPTHETIDLAWFGIAGSFNISGESKDNGEGDSDGGATVRPLNAETMDQIPLNVIPE